MSKEKKNDRPVCIYGPQMMQTQNSQFQTLRTKINDLSPGYYQQTEWAADINVPKHIQVILTFFDVTYEDTN